MARSWIDINNVLSTYADDLEDPRALDEAERIRRAQSRATAVVERVLASKERIELDNDEVVIDLEHDLVDEDA